MEGIKSLLDKYEDRKKVKKPPSHAKAAAVNEIIRVLGQNKMYDFKYWLTKVGKASYSTVLRIVKEAQNLPPEYSKGGYITNKLKPYALPKTSTKRPRTNRRGDSSVTGRERETRKGGVRKVDDTERRVDKE